MKKPLFLILMLCPLLCWPLTTGQAAPAKDQGSKESQVSKGLSPLKSGECRWVTVTSKIHGLNRTPEEAKQEARQEARKLAVEKVLGVKIHEVQQLFKGETNKGIYDNFSQLIHSEVSGKITEEKESKYRSFFENQIPIYTCRLTAKVCAEKGEPNPGFKVNLILNHKDKIYREGDDLILQILPSEDCYLTVFNVLSNGQVRLLFPNEMMPENKITANKWSSVPSEADLARGIHFRMGILPDKDEDTEEILVVATLQECPFITREKSNDGFSYIPTYVGAFLELNKWLIAIPREERTQAEAIYRIIK